MTTVEVIRGDITHQRVDAIVNAANASLLGGGGVDGAIHAAAGPRLLDACREIRRTQWPDGLPTGHAVTTTAGDLPVRHVIHTVGPKHWEHPDGGEQLLASCHRASLDQAHDLGCTSIAFPAISCGVYGWSPEQAAPVAVGAVRDWLDEHPDTSITLVRFVVFNDAALHAFTAAVTPLTPA